MTNSFEQHGFKTPSFKGEILKEVNGKCIGWFKDDRGLIHSNARSSSGEGRMSDYSYDLTQIKKEWYENPDNFPCLMYSSELGFYTYSNIHEYNEYYDEKEDDRLATKEEVMSLYYEGK